MLKDVNRKSIIVCHICGNHDYFMKVCNICGKPVCSLCQSVADENLCRDCEICISLNLNIIPQMRNGND